MGCACLIVCDLETSTVRQPRPELGCCTTGKKVSPYRFVRKLVCLLCKDSLSVSTITIIK
jgi:hypothetical protein